MRLTLLCKVPKRYTTNILGIRQVLFTENMIDTCEKEKSTQ